MCELCSNDIAEREHAKKEMLAQADQFERLAKLYRDMAHGEIQPHGPDVAIVSALAKQTVRHLVAEWV